MDAARTIGIAIILAALDAAFAPALAATAPEDEIPIAGRVLGPDGPVAGAPVGVHLFERGHRDTTTGSDGRFRIALPAGEALLLVGPVPRLGLAQAANRHLRIAGGIPDLEFRLVPGRRVSGILIGEDGMPRGAPGNVMRLSDGANFGLGADPDGRFSGWLPPGEYEIVFFVGEDAGAATEFQIGAEDREDLIVRVMRSLGAEPDPPLALDRISLSPPDSAGFSALRGARGAAPPGHHVVVHLLSVDRIASARADDEGAFEIRLFAPYGSWLQIHVRPTRPGPPGGSEIRTDPRAGPAWVLRHEPRDRHPGDLDGVVPTGAEGAFFTGSIDRLDAAPGEAIRISGRVRMPDPDGRADPRAFATHLRFGLTRLFDETGLELAPVRILASAYLTPTDLPIEGDGPSTCVERGWPLRTGDGLVLRDGVHEGTVRLELAIPDDLPPGWYGVGWGWHIDEGWEGAQAPGFLQEIQHFSLDTLCVIRVGNPGAPALAPLLLPGTVSAGAHGVHPEEARGRWQVSPAAVFAPRTFVAPRCDAGGKPVRYGLEPGLPLVSRANRPFPLSTSAPTIPLRLSGGELRAQLRGPAEFRLQLGPLPIVAGKVGLYGCRPAEVNPARRTRGFPRSFGNNYLAEMLEVSTGDPSFAISFPQPGEYAIEIGGWIDDVHGQRYGIDGRYRLIVGDVLDLDAMTYSGVPFEVGDRWHAGVQVLPPCPADVEVVLRHFPHSDPAQVVERTWRGRANPFGYFDPGEAFRFEAPGEYRADLYVHARSEDGVLRAGSWTSASVVAPVDSPIACRGERGVRSPRSTNRPAWYVEGLSRDIVREPDEGFHAPFPYFPGDVLWLEDGESIFPTVTFIDRDGRWEAILSRLLPDICHGVYSGLFNPDLLPIDRIAIGEIPAVGWGPRPVGQFPRSRRFHGYAYSTTIRPGVAVRSIVQELTPVAYWDLQDPYNLQDGVGPEGDLPGDVKAFFGGVVMRGEGVEGYGVYGSMAVIVPRGDPLGNRVTPPFAGRAGGVDGGPILTVRGRPFDLFVTLTAVRPGTVLVTGDLVRLAGLFWPLVPARLTAEIRGPLSPDADPVWDPLRLETRGNSVGAFATEAVAATRPGRYEVTLRGIHDGSISSGPVRPPYPEGDLLGTPDGRFSFYVVEDEREEATGRSACALDVKAIEEAPGRVRVQGSVPRAWDAAEVRLTATFPGVVLEERRLEIAAGRFEWVYDLEASRRSFPNLDPDPVDTICITLFASGRVEREIRYRASRIILQGRRIHVSP